MVRFVAHFDGKQLLPDEPVNLPTGKPLQVTVEEIPGQPPARQPTPPLNFGQWLDTIEAECGLFEGPRDFAAEHDHYLYGAPKRNAPDAH